jgi:glycine/D-amino acid oxidase-like deaminating enzyme
MQNSIDVVIVGGGSQGLFCLKEAHKLGLNAKCIIGPDIGGHQTVRSQYYLHRGYFYKSLSLSEEFRQARELWERIISESGIDVHRDKCVVGFESIEAAESHVSLWEESSMPFKSVSLPSNHPYAGGNITHFYNVDELWISDARFVEKQFQKYSDHCIFGTVTAIENDVAGYRVDYNMDEEKIVLKAKNIILCAGINNATLINQVATIPSSELQQQRSCQVLVLTGNFPQESLLCPSRKHFICPYTADGVSYSLRCTFGFDPPVLTNTDPPVDQDRLAVQLQALNADLPRILALTEHMSQYTAVKAEYLPYGRGVRPDRPAVVEVTPGLYAIWPTKLTLSPLAAKSVMEML